MKNKIQVLCYGDSNTWGCIGRWKDLPIPSERFDEEHRWPSVLQSRLGDDYNVISEELKAKALEIYSQKEQEITPDQMRELERVVMLKVVDEKWMNHIMQMNS